MNEKPLERLNYYNGQRLEASDLRLEQEYHIRVRRWLNKSLYEPGIAEGLTVRPETDNTSEVVVGPGLALDAEGREIILLEEQRVKVFGKPSAVDGEVEGNYLTIQYREDKRTEDGGSCTPRSSGQDASTGRLAWGGPSRVLAEPILGWSDMLPHESSGKIVLGQVELDTACNVRRVHAGIRRYVGAASAAKVRQYALEGERDIDSKNPGRIFFHIRGRQPKSVTLYLRAEKLSTLYYTELGRHDHKIHVNVNSLIIPAHLHAMPTSTSGSATSHSHAVSSVVADADTSIWGGVFTAIGAAAGLGVVTAPMAPFVASEAAAIFLSNALRPLAPMALTLSPRPFLDRPAADLTQAPISTRVAMTVTVDPEAAPTHTHPLPKSTENFPLNAPSTTYTLSGNGFSDPSGITDPSPPAPAYQAYSARSGDPLTFVKDLEVWIGKPNRLINRTPDILRQLKAAQPTIDWETVKLGNGAANHDLVNEGTGEIRLDFLPGLYFDGSDDAEYCIELRVAKGGGRVRYNLYVE